jgi:hypothetical protein
MKSVILEVVMFLHILVDLFSMTYILIFNQAYDIFYAFWILIQTMHWAILKNECSLSYIEKRIIDPHYKLGSIPFDMPHNDAYHNKYTLKLKAFMIISSLLIIMYRNIQNVNKNSLLIEITCSVGLFLWIYFTYYANK